MKDIICKAKIIRSAFLWVFPLMILLIGAIRGETEYFIVSGIFEIAYQIKAKNKVKGE